MWPGPYGQGGGGRKYLLASLDPSLRRMGLDYVDIFYSHRPDPTTPLEETMGALHTAVVSGKALYAGISSYSPEDTARAAEILADLGTPLLIHQPSYSMLNRWIETEGLLDTLEEVGVGCIAFSPLAQGMLTGKYLDGVPEGSRASQGRSLSTDLLTDEALGHIRALNDIAQQRGQSLAQLALAWALRDPRVTTVLIGASSVGQLEQNLGALDNLAFADDELAAIDQHAVDTGIDLWRAPGRPDRQRSRCGRPAVTSQTRGDAAATRVLSTPSSSRKRRPDGVAGTTPEPTSLLTATTRRRVPRQASTSASTSAASRASASGASDQTPQSSMTRASQVVRQSSSTGGPGRPSTRRQVDRLDRPPGRRPAGPVQGHPVGPLGVAAVGHQPAGDVVDRALAGEQLLGEGGLARPRAAQHERPPRPAEGPDHLASMAVPPASQAGGRAA